MSKISILVTDLEKSQYYIPTEAEIMKLGRHVSIFPETVTDIGKNLDSITVRAECVIFPQIVTDIGKICRNIPLEGKN